jgi:hypothetical protein
MLPVQAVQAAQITFEDYFLSSMDISALKIVGFEGLWGSLAMFLVMLPVVQVQSLLTAKGLACSFPGRGALSGCSSTTDHYGYPCAAAPSRRRGQRHA